VQGETPAEVPEGKTPGIILKSTTSGADPCPTTVVNLKRGGRGRKGGRTTSVQESALFREQAKREKDTRRKRGKRKKWNTSRALSWTGLAIGKKGHLKKKRAGLWASPRSEARRPDRIEKEAQQIQEGPSIGSFARLGYSIIYQGSKAWELI